MWVVTPRYDPITFGTKFPTKDSGFAQGGFADMMWLKSSSVWVVLNLGYNVFFSDVDVMWFTDIVPIIESNVFIGVEQGFDKEKDAYPGKKRPKFDTVWMDTGPRPARQGPFFMNSGFFLLRHTRSTVRQVPPTPSNSLHAISLTLPAAVGVWVPSSFPPGCGTT